MPADDLPDAVLPPDPPAASIEALLGGPQIVIELPPGPDGASFRTWQGHLTFAGSTELVEPGDAAAFQASSRLYMLRQFVLSDSTSSHPCRLRRTGEDVARTGVDHLLITLHLEGIYEGSCGSRPFHARPGDISFIDFGLPYEFETSAYRSLALTVPRSGMPDAVAQRALHGLVPDADLAATQLLSQFMRNASVALPGLTLSQGIAAASAMVELAIGASQGDHGARDVSTRAELDLFSRAQALIERTIADIRLSAATLAQALGVSRGALYGVFVEHGGVQAYVRERRLQRCYEIINGEDRPNETIGAIAFSLGFGSEAHFSRAFKERFGLTPRDLRAVARQRGVNMLPPKVKGVAPDRVQTLGRA